MGAAAGRTTASRRHSSSSSKARTAPPPNPTQPNPTRAGPHRAPPAGPEIRGQSGVAPTRVPAIADGFPGARRRRGRGTSSRGPQRRRASDEKAVGTWEGGRKPPPATEKRKKKKIAQNEDGCDCGQGGKKMFFFAGRQRITARSSAVLSVTASQKLHIILAIHFFNKRSRSDVIVLLP